MSSWRPRARRADRSDIRAIIHDDEALMPHAGEALKAYNLAQLTVVQHGAREGSGAHTVGQYAMRCT